MGEDFFKNHLLCLVLRGFSLLSFQCQSNHSQTDQRREPTGYPSESSMTH